MPRPRAVIRHVLHHVNAEAAESDPSQAAGVAGRVQLVRDSVQAFRKDDRDLTLRALLLEIHDTIPNRAGRASLRRAIVNMRDSGARRPQLVIRQWVGTGLETRSERADG